MTERWYYSRPRLAGIATLERLLDDIERTKTKLGAEALLRSVRVVAPPIRRYRGKQARRAAFYNRQRKSRIMDKLLRCAVAFDSTDHLRDALLYGMSVFEVQRKVPIHETWDDASPGGDKAVRAQYRQNPDGTRTLLRVDEFEPSPVFHFKRVGYEWFASEFYDPPPAGD